MTGWFTFNSLELILLGLIICSLLYQFVYYWCMYLYPMKKLSDKKENVDVPISFLPTVSVIVYANKRSDELRNNLPSILDQNYPNFEVIVINDGSDPDVKDVVTYYQNEYKQLHSTYIPLHTQYVDHKKLALTLGIKAAKYEVLLFTEADCCPESKNWIQSMVKSGIIQGKSFVYGNSHFVTGKGLFYKLISYVSLKMHLRCWSSLSTRKPLLNNIRNMACLKSILLDKDKSSCGIDLRVGGKELISAGIVTKENVSVAMIPESVIKITSPVLFTSIKEGLGYLMNSQQYFSGIALFFNRLESISKGVALLIGLWLILLSVMQNCWSLFGFIIVLFLCKFGLKLTIIYKAKKLLHIPVQIVFYPYWEILIKSISIYLRSCRLFLHQ